MSINQTKQKRFKIVNIHRNFRRNKGTGLEYFVYADLVDEDNTMYISADLNYIFEQIEKYGYLLVDDVL